MLKRVWDGAVILVVEDDSLLRDILDEALREAGFNLLLAKNGSEALNILEASNDSLRGLVSDINLGAGPDGWKVARRARELVASLAVVYMSGASAKEFTSQGVPGSVLVVKPYAPAQVVTAISTLLNESNSKIN